MDNIYIYICTGWWFSWSMTGWFSHSVGNGKIIPIDELIFFRGVATPPTRPFFHDQFWDNEQKDIHRSKLMSMEKLGQWSILMNFDQVLMEFVFLLNVFFSKLWQECSQTTSGERCSRSGMMKEAFEACSNPPQQCRNRNWSSRYATRIRQCTACFGWNSLSMCILQ